LSRSTKPTSEARTKSRSAAAEAKARGRTLTDRLYFVGVSIKGVDGIVELILGLALLLVPSLPHTALEAAANRASSGTIPFGQFISNYLENLDGTLAQWGTWLVIAYLTAHGAIKVLLVVCLLLRLHRVYPVAVVVLGAFLAYEIYLFCVKPGMTLGFFVVLDAVIIYLVIREYRQLRRQAANGMATTNVNSGNSQVHGTPRF
jgi:uncharacterized membrane protein